MHPSFPSGGNDRQEDGVSTSPPPPGQSRLPGHRQESFSDDNNEFSDLDNDEYGPVGGVGEERRNGRKLNRYPFQDVVDE